MSNRPPPPPNNNNSSWNEKKECNAAMEEAFRVEESGEAPQGEEDVQRAMEGYARVSTCIRLRNNVEPEWPRKSLGSEKYLGLNSFECLNQF